VRNRAPTPGKLRPRGARLYTYCIRHDDGAAPNPFWGLCTLAICKPQIRRSARHGDWVVGTGSVNTPIGDTSGRVVYAMRVSDKMTMEDYDAFTRERLPGKLPQWEGPDPRRQRGDSIYDFSCTPPRLRRSVHDESNRQRDLGGKYVLLSDNFYYFGDNAPMLPRHLMAIVKQGQSHRCPLNDPYVNDFLQWIESLAYEPNTILGDPQRWDIKGLARSCGPAQRSHQLPPGSHVTEHYWPEGGVQSYIDEPWPG
jgi:hypothetical protein